MRIDLIFIWPIGKLPRDVEGLRKIQQQTRLRYITIWVNDDG